MPFDPNQHLHKISYRNLPINWQALSLLGKEINRFQEAPYASRDLTTIKPPKEAKALIVMIASVVTNFYHPEVPQVLPTKAELVALRPWIRSLENTIARVSAKWAARFGAYVESRGQELIVNLGKGIIETIEMSRRFEAPRAQFVHELTSLYLTIAQPVTKDGFLGGYPMSIEEKIEKMFATLKYGRGLFGGLNEGNFPLLFALCKKFSFPSATFSDREAGIAGAEFMQGILAFLQKLSVRGLPQPQRAQTFDLFDPGTWERAIAETFYGEKLEMVRRRLPILLDLLRQVLPESGEELAYALYNMTVSIHGLGVSGVPIDVILKSVFQK